MSNFDFTQPTRQSTKGIIIIFGYQAFKLFKNVLIAFIPLIYSFLNKGSLFGLGMIQIFFIVLAILFFILIISILRFWNFKFYVSEEGFHLEKGILNKENTLIPRGKIQNVYIKQNLLQQLIHVSSLTIETAGNDKAEVEISALESSFALELKRDLMSHKTSESLQEDTIVYYQASLKTLILEGATNNHIKSSFLLFGFFMGLYYENRKFLEELPINDSLEEFLNAGSSSLLVILFPVAVLLAGVIFFSIIKTILVNYNLKVIEEKQNIEISKGLFNKVTLNLLPSRIQIVTITTNWLKQLFKLHTIHIKQAMASKNQKEQLSVVGLNVDQVYYLIRHVYADFKNPENKLKPEFYFKRLLIIRCAIVLSVLNGIIFMTGNNGLWWLNILAIPYAILYVQIVYRKAFYSMDETYVTVEGGFIDSFRHIIEIHKIQSVSFTQSIFQKKKNIASLKIGTASNNLQIRHIKEEQAKHLMNYLLYKVENSKKNWM